MTTTTQKCTPEQIAEWNAMHARMSELAKAHDAAEGMATHYLRRHIETGAMTPGAFGLPSEEALDYYRRACESVIEADAAWDERARVGERVEAHPFTAEVRARDVA